MPLIRNAGGRASEDAIRSLVISYKLLEKSLETGDWKRSRRRPSRRGIGLVEIPFVEPEAEVCQADLLGVLVESGRRLAAPRFESKVAIDVMKPENA